MSITYRYPVAGLKEPSLYQLHVSFAMVTFPTPEAGEHWNVGSAGLVGGTTGLMGVVGLVALATDGQSRGIAFMMKTATVVRSRT
jgi:hypothetical protein